MNVHAHKQIRTQVWAMVDTGIADAVHRLNEMAGVMTHTSCEGDTAYAPYIMVSWDDDEARARILAEYTLTDEGDHWAYAHPVKCTNCTNMRHQGRFVGPLCAPCSAIDGEAAK